MSKGPLHYTWQDKPHRLVYDLIAAVKHYANQAGQAAPAPVPVPVPSGLRVERGFRWDDKALHHIPNLLVEFEPVPALSPNDMKGWKDRDAIAAMLTTPRPAPASGETEICKCCGEGSARIVVRRECDICTSVYAGVAEHRIQKSLAAPPAQEVRVPLTEKQISKLWSDAHNDTSDRMAHQVLVRLVETAHGITAAPTGCASNGSEKEE